MGLYDSFFRTTKEGSKAELQLKNGDRDLHEFEEGDEVSKYGYEDGIYVDSTGFGYVVIKDGKYVAGFAEDAMQDKWSHPIDFNRVKECY